MPLKNLFILFLSVPSFLSCNSTVNGILGKKRTAHESYAEQIEKHPNGRAWLDVSNSVLLMPQTIKLPYQQLGVFPVDKPRALALQFTAKRGEKINFGLTIKSIGADLFADIFKKDGETTTHILGAAITDTAFGFDVDETGAYLIRLQPQLNAEVEYSLTASVLPSLGFPVAGSKASVGSVWGDSRDGGKRSHEGIDIFAAKRTPVVAAADGYISSVNNGGLGGKTVNLKVAERNISLYYAHLDEQWVQEGQFVKKGDTLGLVGNTGNAKRTAPHLHFGIYTYNGAIDPLPFVDRISQKITPVKERNIPASLKLTKTLKIKTGGTIRSNTILVPLALTTKGYIAELPDGRIVDAPLNAVMIIKPARGS